jgi:outer membrane cobalamin receptor
MIKVYARAFAILLLIICPSVSFSQDLDSLLNLSAFTAESDLQKALNKNLTVSSSKALSTRETPGIISVITAEEIRNAGARDLIDVLRLVPGFDVAQDVSFVMGIGLRGSWANEGKVLVMLDGQPFNDLLYQGVSLGNHFPIDAISRIEIIRGPGSAIYGGSAEYGVINMITKGADQLNGVNVYGIGGFHADAVGRTNGGITIAKKSEDVSWDVSFFKGKGIVSNQKFISLYGDTVNTEKSNISDLSKSTTANPMNINVGLRMKNFSLRTMYDNFQTSEPATDLISFKNFFLDLKYDWKINKKLLITPQVRYYNQVPWQYHLTDDSDALKVRAVRNYAGLSFSYEASRKININFGGVYFTDRATDLQKTEYLLGSNEVSFNNFALFAQSLLKHRLANATLGFRYERNNQYGSAFVPRLALTRKIENFHFKLLYSQAFRAPSIENINLAPEGTKIKPEKSQVFEAEFGYQFTPEMLLAVNAFKLNTKNVIVYGSSTEDFGGSYQNFSKTGTQGLELVYTIHKKNWYANATYSFSRAAKNSTVDSYAIPQTNKQFVGLAAQKFTLSTNFNLTSNLTFNPTFIAVGKRYAYTAVDRSEDPDGIPVISKLDPYLLVNTFLNYQNVIKGLSLGVGVYDILNQKPSIPQAYNGDYAPIPGRTREYVVKLSYQLDFNK